MSAYGDWAKGDVIRAIESAKSEGKTGVALDLEHATYQNEQDVLKWVKEMGHEGELTFETVHVYFKK